MTPAGHRIPDPAEDTGRSYYGRPVLKEPVWKWYIPAYFFTGGLAGASSTLAVAARLAGNHRLARSALVTSAAAMVVSPALLVADLGRPRRFLNMLRMAKPTSPMSVGTWLLAVFAPAALASAVLDLAGALPSLGWACELVAGTVGPAVATYTAVLVADTAIPAWHNAGAELPFVFAAGAGASAGAMATLLTDESAAGPARRLAVMASIAELAATAAMEHRSEKPRSRSGPLAVDSHAALKSVTLSRTSRALTAAGAGLLAAIDPMIALGAALSRFAVFHRGFESARAS